MLQRARSPHHPAAPEAFENEVICMRLARSIIDDFCNVPEEHPKYTFPFLHYLSSATIIALGLIFKQPSFKSKYGVLTLEAARSLREHCHKTWVSGKMAQTVWKLNQMADATLSFDDRPPGAIEGPAPDTNESRTPSTSAQRRAHFVTVEPPSIASQMSMSEMAATRPTELEPDISLSEEMIDCGMEWLQGLFANGLDTHLLPVWD